MEEACNQIHFESFRADSVLDICRLSESLPGEQRNAVADNALSIAQAHISENAWMRAIYLGDTPIGLIMRNVGSDLEDGIDCFEKEAQKNFTKNWEKKSWYRLRHSRLEPEFFT